MASKNIQVVYVVNDAALLKAANSLKANEDAAKKADSAVSKYGKDAKKAGDDASKSFLNLGTIWKGLIAIGITTFFVNLAKKTFELGVKQEQLNIAFTTFLGSAEKAKKLLQDLTKFAIVTPFTPDQVNNAAKALLAFGVAGNEIIPTLKMLGDVSSGTGKDLTEMAIIFGQIRSTGRLMGQDLLQLINAGFNPLQIISEQTGKSVGRLKKEMEAGLITFDMVSDAFKTATSEGGRFFNLMEKQSLSVGGLISTVSGNVDEALKAIFTANTGLVSEFVAALVKASEGLIAFSLTADQVQEKFNAGVKDSFKTQFEELVKTTGSLEVATAAMTKSLNESIDLYEQQLKEIQKSKDATKEEEDAVLSALRAKRQQLIALGEYTQAIKDEAEAKEKADLLKTLEAETKAREEQEKALKKLKDAYHAYAQEVEKGLGKAEADEPEIKLEVDHLANQNGFLTEDQRKKLEEDTKASLARMDAAQDAAAQEDIDRELRKQEHIRQLRQAAFDFGINLIGQFLMAQIDEDDRTFEREKGNFDQRLANAGDNARARMEIEAERVKFEQQQDLKAEEFAKEKAKRDKERQLKEMAIQNVLNALKAIGQPPVPNFPLALITLAFGAAQIGLAKSVGFKDGVINLQGPGTTTSDSIPARLSRGESVINAESTARSMDLLEAINDGKIDDRFLKNLKGSNAPIILKDNSDVVAAIEGSRVDHYQYGHVLMEAVRRGKNLKVHSISKYRNS